MKWVTAFAGVAAFSLVTQAAPAAESVTPPCPPSPVFAGIDWAPAESVVRQALDGDNWPVTWATDDALYTRVDSQSQPPNMNNVLCNGIGGAKAGTVKTTAGGVAVITVGAVMDATHVKTSGTYKLSNHATGPFNIKVIDQPTSTTYGPVTADLSVAFTSLVGFSSTSGLNFGNGVAPVAPTGADHADLGTNGTIAYTGGFSSLPGGSPGAGQVTMNNIQNGVTVEVSCDTTVTLAKSGASTSTIQVTGVKVAPEGSTGTYAGAGTLCAGTGTVATTMSYTAGTADQFFFGGKLDGGTTTNWSNTGIYSSSNAGGTNMQVIVINQ